MLAPHICVRGGVQMVLYKITIFICHFAAIKNLLRLLGLNQASQVHKKEKPPSGGFSSVNSKQLIFGYSQILCVVVVGNDADNVYAMWQARKIIARLCFQPAFYFCAITVQYNHLFYISRIDIA